MILPDRETIEVDPPSAAMGSFNRSLKGLRKNIRRILIGPPTLTRTLDGEPRGGRVEELLRIIDHQLSGWTRMGVVWMSEDLDLGLEGGRVLDQTLYPDPGLASPRLASATAQEVSQPTIIEITRSPHMLTWDVPDPFARYLVHSVARYYSIVSFTRHVSRSGQTPQKVVCMVKAHLPTRQGRRRLGGSQALDTPPTTDLGSELSTTELSDAPSTIDDEVQSERAPEDLVAPVSSHISPQLKVSYPPQPTPIKLDSSQSVEREDTDDSSRCASDADEVDSNMSDSGFLPPKSAELTPRAGLSWVQTSSSAITPITPTPRGSYPRLSKTRSSPPQILLSTPRHLAKPKNSIYYPVPAVGFLTWILADG